MFSQFATYYVKLQLPIWNSQLINAICYLQLQIAVWNEQIIFSKSADVVTIIVNIINFFNLRNG